MKRISKCLLVIFILILGISFNVYAETIDYYLSNSAQNYEYVNKDNNKAVNVKRGDYIYVTSMFDHKNLQAYYMLTGGKLTVRWDEKYLSLEEVDGKYYSLANTDLKYLKIGSVSKYSNRITLNDLSDRTGYLKEGKIKVVEFKFRVLDSAASGVTKIYQMDGEDNLECVCSTCAGGVNNPLSSSNCSTSLYSELKYNITKSTVNSLSMIKIDNHDLEYFDENHSSYDITVESNVEKINITAIKKDNRSVVTGDIGEKKLNYGINKLTIDVISESGVKKTYKLNIEREDLRSDNNALKSLTLSAGEINFKSGVTSYVINVANEVDKINIKSTLADNKSRYVEDFKDRDIILVEGSNKVEIKIISEKGDIKIYTLNINRALSGNNSLKSLKVNDEKIKLVENEFIYDIVFENDVSEAVINAVTSDVNATVKLEDKYELQVGVNEFIIKVVAANGSEASYTLNITRKKILSKDSLLRNLRITGYNLNFNQNVKVYNLRIKDEDTLEINTIPEDENATIEIEGNKDLINGSIVKINVKAEDGTYTRYFINIEKVQKGISPVIIILIVLLLLLGICLGIILYRKKRKNSEVISKKDYVNEETEKTEEYIGAHESEEDIKKDA